MATIPYKPGASVPFVVRLEAEDCDPVAYVRTQIRVQGARDSDSIVAGPSRRKETLNPVI